MFHYATLFLLITRMWTSQPHLVWLCGSFQIVHICDSNRCQMGFNSHRSTWSGKRDSEWGKESGKSGVKQETMVTPCLGLHREPPWGFWIVKIHISLFLLSSSLLSSLETLRQHTILLQALSIVHVLSA